VLGGADKEGLYGQIFELYKMPERNVYCFLPHRLGRNGQDHPTSQVDLRGVETSAAALPAYYLI